MKTKTPNPINTTRTSNRAQYSKHGNFAHGNTKKSKTLQSWYKMRDRVYNKTEINYDIYGGRGITISERWDSFDNFLIDMGVRPEGTSLDRIDVNGPYSPENCRWATKKEQARNRSNNIYLNYRGQTYSFADIVDILGLRYSKAYYHIVKKAKELRRTPQQMLDDYLKSFECFHIDFGV